MMRHFGMTPRTTEVGAKEQNGDVEAANGAFKRRLEQALLVRGSRDFESVEKWQAFIDELARKVNVSRGQRVAEELAVMRELNVGKLPGYGEGVARGREGETSPRPRCAHSAPSRPEGRRLDDPVYRHRNS